MIVPKPVSLLCNQALVLHRYVIHLAQETRKIVGLSRIATRAFVGFATFPSNCNIFEVVQVRRTQQKCFMSTA